jgi:exosortase
MIPVAEHLVESSKAVGIPTGALKWVAVPFLAWWLLAYIPIAGHWDTNPQYSYGWYVLPLALLLAWRRWQTRPSPGPAPGWSPFLIAASAAAVFPAWLIIAPNPGWRFVLWFLALTVVAGTVGLSARLGGLPWARHFSFPIFFTLVAVPWPSHPEAFVVQGLMRCVAAVTAMLLNLIGVAATQRGNLVEVSTGVLGVDEACSGVRSLQAALMVALFLGEFYRLRTRPRFLLLAMGFFVAMLTNIVRTSFLSISAARHGLEAVEKYHDPAGYTVLTACLLVLALFATWLAGKSSPQAFASNYASPHPIPASMPIVLTAWLAFIFAGTEAWYFRAPQKEASSWSITVPAGASEQALPAATRELLGCDRSSATSWKGAGGARWTLFFLEWFPNNQRTALLARVHRPELCLPSAGLIEAGPRRTLNIPVAGFDLAFQSMHFRDAAGRDAFVFYCPWEIVPGQPGRNAEFQSDTRTASLRRVWKRDRVLGQQTAELFVTGVQNRDLAEELLRGELQRLVVPSVAPGLENSAGLQLSFSK